MKRAAIFHHWAPRIAVIFGEDYLYRILTLALAYFVAGFIGLQLQSAQTGVTPFWPASGVALAALILYGVKLWPGIFLGMLALVVAVDLPLWVSLTAGAGSVLEAVIPLLLFRRYGFDGSINSLQQLKFFILISWLGPLFSASFGTLSLVISQQNLVIPPLNIFLIWWLGNSFGILLMGSILILVHECVKGSACSQLRSPALLPLSLAATIISLGACHSMGDISSSLILSLMAPVVILGGLYIGFAGALIPATISITIMLALADQFPAHAIDQYPIGVLYLDIAQLWIITLTGLLVHVAHREGLRGMEAKWLSSHDCLTSLHNRRHLEKELDQLCQGMRTSDRIFSLLFLDLNKFKRINDEAGHLTGDQGLNHVARVLRLCTRESDITARWGGDEFVVLLPDCPLGTAVQVAENINRRLADEPFIAGNRKYRLSFSIGITSGSHGESSESIISRADKAGYAAKRSGELIRVASG